MACPYFLRNQGAGGVIIVGHPLVLVAQLPVAAHYLGIEVDRRLDVPGDHRWHGRRVRGAHHRSSSARLEADA